MATPKVYHNYINGEWVEAQSGQTLENRNPADTNDLIGIFPSSGAADVEQAVAAAREAYKKWRLVPAPKRAEILYRTVQMLATRVGGCFPAKAPPSSPPPAWPAKAHTGAN